MSIQEIFRPAIRNLTAAIWGIAGLDILSIESYSIPTNDMILSGHKSIASRPSTDC